jgi:hypothetical protein
MRRAFDFEVIIRKRSHILCGMASLPNIFTISRLSTLLLVYRMSPAFRDRAYACEMVEAWRALRYAAPTVRVRILTISLICSGHIHVSEIDRDHFCRNSASASMKLCAFNDLITGRTWRIDAWLTSMGERGRATASDAGISLRRFG